MEQFLNNLLLVGSVIVLTSVLLSKPSERFGLPILVIFLFIGIVAGSEGLGGIHFENYELTHSLSIIALCLIIFSGAIETKVSDIKESFWRGVSLSSFGVVITTVLVGHFVKLLTNFSLLESYLMGAILSATDAAAVFAAFKSRDSQVTAKTKSLLKFESGSNDPMAYFLVTVILGLMDLNHTQELSDIGVGLILNPLVGLMVGWLVAKSFIYLNNRINLEQIGLYPALTLSFIFFSYSLSTYFHGNGFLCVYVFGLVVSSKKILHRSLLYIFYDGVSWLSQIGLFVMLGLLVFPSRIVKVSSSGILVALFLIFIARPVTIFICLAFSKFSFKEKLFVSWAGLKGATPIIFASFAALKLGARAHIIFDIVFFTVLVSAVLQGTTLKMVARKLGLLIESIEDPSFPVDFDLIEKTRNGIKEFKVEENDYCIAKRIIDLHLPKGSLVLFVKRQGSFIIPDGATAFSQQDRILLVTNDKADLSKALECFKIGNP